MLAVLLLPGCASREPRPETPAATDGLEVQRSRILEGRAAREHGDLVRARELHEQAVEALRTTLPADDPRVLLAREELGLTLERCGEAQPALELVREVFDVRSRTLPPDDPQVLRARLHVALVLKRLGRLDEALAEEEIVLESREKSLPDDHPDLQIARINLGVTLHDLGRLAESRALKEKALEVYERTLPVDSVVLATARSNLAATLYVQGDLPASTRLQEAALEVFERALDPESTQLQMMRMNIGVLRLKTGDAPGARAVFQKVCPILERTRPPDDLDLQFARVNLAIALRISGELDAARALAEKVLEVQVRTLPPDHADPTFTREVLGTILSEQGSWSEAEAVFRDVVATYERTLPPDHPRILSGRRHLGIALAQLGDYGRAREILESVLEVQEQSLPPGHPDLQNVRVNLAAALSGLGDDAAARALEERAVEELRLTLPDDDPVVLTARWNLAATCSRDGEFERAEAIDREVLDVMEGSLPEEHPKLQMARQRLAMDLVRVGKLAEARELQETAVESLSLGLPRDHALVQNARLDLAATLWMQGDTDAGIGALEEYLAIAAAAPWREPSGVRTAKLNLARELAWVERHADSARVARELLRSVRESLDAAATSLSAREAEETAIACGRHLSGAITLALAAGPERDPAWADEILAATEAARGIGVRALRVRRLEASGDGAERIARVREAIRAVGARIARSASADGGEDAVDDLVRERDRLERELGAELASTPGAESLARGPDAAAIRSRLRAGEVALAFWRYLEIGREQTTRPGEETAKLVALVVRREGPVEMLDLGPMAAVEAAVTEWQELASIPGAEVRGVHAGKRPSSPAAERSAAVRLRGVLLDPLRKAIDGSSRVVIVLDDVLHLVPFDALPDFDGGEPEERRIGDRVPILRRSTLADPAASEGGAGEGSDLLALGGVEYSDLPSLPATLDEAHAVIGLHRQVSDESGRARLLTGDEATASKLEEIAPRCRFLHLATHGYCAPDSVPSMSDRDDFDSRSRTQQAIRGLAPMTLCGLALAGETITAEEIGALDLSRCELAVLSACETSVGLRRAGQGLSSLQKALQAAGARSSITSLWKVPDEATRELMVEFYRRLWVEKQPAHEALWGAKLALRKAGHPTADWAAWVLTGDPP